MGVVEPAFSPLYLGLYGCEPWVAQYEVQVAQTGEEESHVLPLLSTLDFQIGVVVNGTLFIHCAVHVLYGAWVFQGFKWDSVPPCEGFAHEVLSRS